MRTFIAIDFPPSALEKIAEISNFFKQQTPQNALKWVETPNTHLTIKFIGEIEEVILPVVKEKLSQALQNLKPYSIQISGLGMYPNKKNPRVVWLGILGAEPLVEIHRLINEKLVEIGIKADHRPFSPHMTIARVRQSAKPETVNLIGRTLSKFRVDPLNEIRIDQVHLYKSDLLPSGPVYSILHTIHLNQV